MHAQRPISVLVFAGVPPPVHGQNVMVAAMLAGLRADKRFRIFHVNPQLSRNHTEIGRWQPGKLLRLLIACCKALNLRLRHGPMLFYYIPAPAKRAAMVRDWIVMLLCRPFFPKLVLHWHAVGLGDWLQNQAKPWERGLTRRLLGESASSFVLAAELAADAKAFNPRSVQVVENGIADHASDLPPRSPRGGTKPFQVLFLGLGSADKGLFRTLAAVNTANARRPGAFALTFAGEFAEKSDERTFLAAVAYSQGLIRHAGFAGGDAKRELLRAADVICFPTQYPHEGQPLVLIEAMAFDLPVIATRWRAIPSMLPDEGVWLVEPDQPEQLADALLAAAATAPPVGVLRRRYEEHFTLQAHLHRVAEALLKTAG